MNNCDTGKKILEAITSNGNLTRRQLVEMNIGTEYAIASHLTRMVGSGKLDLNNGSYSIAMGKGFLLQAVWK